MREGEVRQGLLEAENYERRQRGEPLEEYRGPAAHAKYVAKIEGHVKAIERLEDQNDRTEALLYFVKVFCKDSKTLKVVNAMVVIQDYWGALPPGFGDLRNGMWKRAAKIAEKKIGDFHDWQLIAEPLNLPLL
jgi:hypothetical protein